jgi:serine protease
LWLALRRAVENNLIVLAAAGNCVREVVFPARYEDCIAVAGVNSMDEPWQGTCCGPDVAISAPGENVYRASVKRDDATGAIAFSVGQGQGTSFAVALTAGVAALWLAHHGRDKLIAFAKSKGETLQATFRRLLRATARRPGLNWDATAMGAGIVDTNALLRADPSTGLDREGFGLQVAGEAPNAVRRLVLAFTHSASAAQAPIDWDRFGPEIAYALFANARGIAPISREAKVAPEAAQMLEHPTLSPQLETALASAPDLARQLGPLRS